MSKRGFPRADLQGMKAEACRLLPTTSTLTWPITSSSARARCAAMADVISAASSSTTLADHVGRSGWSGLSQCGQRLGGGCARAVRMACRIAGRLG